MLNDIISKFDSLIEEASAHCDIPCGIYDARTVMYHAVSTLRQIDILLSLKEKGLSETGSVSYTHLTLPTICSV